MPYIQKRRVGVERKYDKNVAKYHNDKWGHYYGDRRWKRLRDWFMSTHLICEDCMFEGRSVPADECHHRIPFSFFDLEQDRIAAMLDPDNLVALCRSCHMKRHKNLKKPDNFEQTEYYKKIHSISGT